MSEHLIDEETRFKLIKKIEANPEISQRELAIELGVSLGKVNYLLKALVDVGWVKVGNFARSKNKAGYVYCLTPAGIKKKTELALRFLESKQIQYEQIKKEILQLQKDVTKS